MRLFGAIVIVTGFALWWIFVAVYWTGYQAKRLSNKQGRQEIKTEVTETVSFIAKDKDFHKSLNKEFRGLYIVIGLVVVALIASALGLG
jgi:cytoskeletal protein RodZ